MLTVIGIAASVSIGIKRIAESWEILPTKKSTCYCANKNAKNVQTDNNPKVQTTESPINELTDFGKYAIDGPKSISLSQPLVSVLNN